MIFFVKYNRCGRQWGLSYSYEILSHCLWNKSFVNMFLCEQKQQKTRLQLLMKGKQWTLELILAPSIFDVWIICVPINSSLKNKFVQQLLAFIIWQGKTTWLLNSYQVYIILNIRKKFQDKETEMYIHALNLKCEFCLKFLFFSFLIIYLFVSERI